MMKKLLLMTSLLTISGACLAEKSANDMAELMRIVYGFDDRETRNTSRNLSYAKDKCHEEFPEGVSLNSVKRLMVGYNKDHNTGIDIKSFEDCNRQTLRGQQEYYEEHLTNSQRAKLESIKERDSWSKEEDIWKASAQSYHERNKRAEKYRQPLETAQAAYINNRPA
jgi:hypothetical protein